MSTQRTKDNNTFIMERRYYVPHLKRDEYPEDKGQQYIDNGETILCIASEER